MDRPTPESNESRSGWMPALADLRNSVLVGVTTSPTPRPPEYRGLADKKLPRPSDPNMISSGFAVDS